MKKNITMILAMCLMAAAMTACGGSDAADDTADAPAADTVAAADAGEDTEAEADAEADAEAEADDSADDAEEAVEDDASADESDSGEFTLLDVTSDMITTGVYAVDDNQNELVFTMFTEPSGTPMASLFLYAPDGTGDVICGAYTADVETDEDNITWTSLNVSDVYTGNDFTIGFAESEDGQVSIIDTTGTVYAGEYLSADDAVVYMGTAVALLS